MNGASRRKSERHTPPLPWDSQTVTLHDIARLWTVHALQLRCIIATIVPLHQTTTWKKEELQRLSRRWCIEIFQHPRRRFQVCLLLLSPNVDIINNVTRHTFVWGFTSCQKLFLCECQLSPYTSNPGADWIPGNKRIGRGSRLKNSSVSLNTLKYFVIQPSVDGYFGIKVLNHQHWRSFPCTDLPESF